MLISKELLPSPSQGLHSAHTYRSASSLSSAAPNTTDPRFAVRHLMQCACYRGQRLKCHTIKAFVSVAVMTTVSSFPIPPALYYILSGSQTDTKEKKVPDRLTLRCISKEAVVARGPMIHCRVLPVTSRVAYVLQWRGEMRLRASV